MDDPKLRLKKLVERAIQGHDLPLALLLEHLAPVAAMRELARKSGASPKGGFRIEKAPANVLAPLLAETRDAEQLAEVLALLVPRPSPRAPREDGAGRDEAKALLELRDRELQRLGQELDRARQGAARALERAEDLQRRVDAAAREQVVLRREIEQLRKAPKAVEAPLPAGERELQRRLRDLEAEREGFLAADEALRRQLAHNQSRLRELEETNAELDALLPKGKRRKRAPEPAPEPEKRFRLPRFLPSFYKSLDGKDRKSIERAFQAILLFCTEGHGYPGLEVKQLGGQDTWSLRASLGLRVYFRPLPDGDIELLELADREEQHTTLRRLKDK